MPNFLSMYKAELGQNTSAPLGLRAGEDGGLT